MTPADALRNARPRIQAALAEGSFLAVQEAQGSGATDAEAAEILAAYGAGWREMAEWLDARGATA
ncbi:hypothetical protein LEP48_01300 [Isoptericola sp. NEAU-Y5]|uniref:Uncharacterized protein n=1 Tax=Isoptericola luteus TaxID=2879484 RepID=A0ABS7ZAA8_9MICO|nr:hypothetical protein [Isoptericola sp. NEAU-Y5]MCA5891986.1 hypothetical protein [Isoptericola sp. NEAU-Y5]